MQARIKTISGELTLLEEAADKAGEAEERKWRLTAPTSAVSKDGATLTVQKDGAISASDKSPPEDTYVVTISLPAGLHTALRLEALPEKLPSGELAVGRNGLNANFVLSELTVELLDNPNARQVKLTGARADFAHPEGFVIKAIDADEKTGWSVSTRAREKHTAIFNFKAPLKLTDDRQLRVTLSQQSGDSSTLRRFRLSTSSADPSTLEPGRYLPRFASCVMISRALIRHRKTSMSASCDCHSCANSLQTSYAKLGFIGEVIFSILAILFHPEFLLPSIDFRKERRSIDLASPDGW